MLKRNFLILKRIGEGAYSSVYKVRRYSDGEIYALKKVRLPKLTLKGIYQRSSY